MSKCKQGKACRYAWFAPHVIGEFDWIGPTASLLEADASPPQLTALGQLYVSSPSNQSAQVHFSYCPELHLHASHVHALIKLTHPILFHGRLLCMSACMDRVRRLSREGPGVAQSAADEMWACLMHGHAAGGVPGGGRRHPVSRGQGGHHRGAAGRVQVRLLDGGVLLLLGRQPEPPRRVRAGALQGLRPA